MALPVYKQIQYWSVALAVFLLLLWLFGNVLFPFLVGGALAYLMDPTADRLERWGFSRVFAVASLSLVTLFVIGIVLLLIIPNVIKQMIALFEFAPTAFDAIESWIVTRFPDIVDETSTIRQSLDVIGNTLRDRGGELVNGVVSSVTGVVNALVFLIITPVVTFYLLIDWDRLVAQVDRLLPRDHASTIRRLGREIDMTLNGFIRGQGLVCLILGTFYAVSLMAVGLNYGLAVGAFAGMISFIPYIGSIVGGALSIGLALYQFWGDWVMVFAVYAIFQVGQMVEGNILTPRLVGSSVGLHPVWLLFALSAFGSLFGFVGMLVAVPVAAVIGVLVRFGIGQYLESKLYLGFDAAAEDASDSEKGRLELEAHEDDPETS